MKFYVAEIAVAGERIYVGPIHRDLAARPLLIIFFHHIFCNGRNKYNNQNYKENDGADGNDENLPYFGMRHTERSNIQKKLTTLRVRSQERMTEVPFKTLISFLTFSR